MSEFNFNSAICTSREQSERLLALGLKKETADMHHYRWSEGYWDIQACPPRGDSSSFIPAWSLGRLLEMLPNEVKSKEDIQSYTGNLYLDISSVGVAYAYFDYDGDDRTFVGWCGNDLFAAIVDAIEWLIKEGYFNKEYLV